MSSTDAAGTEVRNENLVPAKDVQRKKTVAVIETMEVTLGLVTVNLVIGRIEIQDHFFGRLVEAIEKRVHENFVQLEDRL